MVDLRMKFIDEIPDPIIIFDVNGKILECNEYFINSLKISIGKEEILKGNVFDFIAKRDLDKVRSDFDSAIKIGPVGGKIYTVTREDGSEFPAEISAKFLKLDDKILVFCVFRDVTKRIEAQVKCQESEQKYRELVENVNSIIFKWDANGKILFFNDYGLKFFGFSLEEVLGRSVFETIIPKRDTMGLDLTLLADKILTNHQYVDNINENVKKNGKRVWVHWTNKPVKDEKGELVILSVGTDITERKKMENELKNYSERLQLLVAEKTKEVQDAQRLAIIGETATMVGHDLRNPLQSIVNTVFILNKKNKEIPPSPRRDELTNNYERIERNVSYMSKIVSDLLDYARPMVPEFSVISLERLINETLADIKVPDNITITLLFDRTLKIMVDRQLIKRAFTNLINNAIQAMPDGGVLTMTAEDTDQGTLMKFTDTGQGIPDDMMKNLFTPFATTKAKGMGMGLVIVKRIIDAHKGDLDVRSEVGKGTTFAITIPLKQLS